MSVRAAAVAVLMATALGTGAATAQTADWPIDLQDRGWTKVTTTSDEVFYVRAAQNAPGSPYKRLWLRHEFRTAVPTDGSKTAFSDVALVEYDCRTGGSRFLQSDEYERPNLAGDVLANTFSLSGWEYSVPGSLGDDANRIACATSK